MPFKSRITDQIEFLRLARERFAAAKSADEIDRKEAEDDIEFAAGGDGQWAPEALEMRRPADKAKPRRPVLTWNMLTEPINQVCNDGRQMKPSIHTTALDGGTKETAEYFQGRIRHIEYESDSDTAYDTSREQAITCGRGFYRVRTEYESFRSFEQRIVIEPIENQFSVVVDLSAKKYDRSDADWWFIIGRVSRDQFKRKYGEDALNRYTSFTTEDEFWARDWLGTDQLIPDVEYWVREYEDDTLYFLTITGKALLGRELKGAGLEARGKDLFQIGSEQAVESRSRPVKVPSVVQYIINGVEILDEHEWLGTIIPIIPYWGRSMIVKGRRRTFSLIRDAKDPQRVVNLTVANIAELTAQIPKTKYAVVEGQLAGHTDEWDPNSPYLYKQYKRWDASGRELPPPVPDAAEPPIQALSVQLGQAIDAVKKATAIFGASLGDRSNETSGRAINARKIESDVANFHFLDNEARSRKLLGRILVELIPLLDQGQKQRPVRGEDGTSKLVWVNKPFKDEKGQEVHIKPAEGDYGVAISTGPTYTSQRQEAADTYGQIAKSDQNFMAIAGDLYFRNLDAPGADQIADRYAQAVIPPQFRPPDKKNPQAQIPPQVQAQMQALMQQHEQLVGQLNVLSEELKSKKFELDSRERIAGMQEETKRTIALAQIDSREGIVRLEQEISSIQHTLDLLHQTRIQDYAEYVARQQAQAQAAGGGNRGQPGASAGPGAPAPAQPPEPTPGPTPTPSTAQMETQP